MLRRLIETAATLGRSAQFRYWQGRSNRVTGVRGFPVAAFVAGVGQLTRTRAEVIAFYFALPSGRATPTV